MLLPDYPRHSGAVKVPRQLLQPLRYAKRGVAHPSSQGYDVTGTTASTVTKRKTSRPIFSDKACLWRDDLCVVQIINGTGQRPSLQNKCAQNKNALSDFFRQGVLRETNFLVVRDPRCIRIQDYVTRVDKPGHVDIRRILKNAVRCLTRPIDRWKHRVGYIIACHDAAASIAEDHNCSPAFPDAARCVLVR